MTVDPLRNILQSIDLWFMFCCMRVDMNQPTTNGDKFQSILLSRGSTDDFIVNVGGHSIPPNNTLKCRVLPLLIN